MSNNSTAGPQGQDALSIHRRAIIVDMHADTTQRLVDEKVDLEQRLPDGHFDAVRAKDGPRARAAALRLLAHTEQELHAVLD